MLQSTELEIKLSETRTELRALQAGPPADDATEEVRAAFDVKLSDGMKSLDDLETQKRTALKAEEVAQERALKLVNVEQRVGAGDLPNMPPEFREFMGIEARCSLDGFFDGLHENIETLGAEREMRQALGITERGTIPWPMLIEPKRLQEIRQEQRAALAEGAKVRAIIGKEFADKIGEGNDVFLRAAFGSGSTVMSMQDPVIQDVFGASVASFLMTRFSSAPVGDALELVLTSTGASIKADRATQTAAGSLAARTLTPKAIRAVYDINKTDLQRFRGLESSLRADLPRAINDVVDANVINGSSFSGSILARAAAGTTPTAVPTFGSAITEIALGIDGKHARTLKEVKVVVNPLTLRQFYGLLASNTAVTLPDYFMMNTGGIMTTSNMPAKSGSISKAILCRTGPGVQYNGVAKVWGGGIQVIRDEYTKAPENQLIITANLYADFDVVRVAGYRAPEFFSS